MRAASLLAVLLAAGCGSKVETTGAILHVTSLPVDGAQVMIGGINRGDTPCSVANIPPGDVYVIVSKDGYQRASKLVIVPETGEVEVAIEMDPIIGYLTLDSEPTGAAVTLDGEHHIGHTPLRGIPISIGDRKYRIELDNYHPIESDLLIEDGRRYTKRHVLEPIHSSVQILSRPTGARIWIDGEPQERPTPLRVELPPGTYTITVYAKGYISGEQTIVLAPNESRDVTLPLEIGNVPEGMVLIPAGEFKFGDPSAPEERPQVSVHLDAYYIDKFEVTNADFQKVFPNHTFEPGTGNWPVCNVNWKDAVEYARRVGKRLPTEKEWEKAARGEDGRQWPWGNTFDKTRVNYKGTNLDPMPVAVGDLRLGGSPYGLMNASGNVYEWVSDWYQAYPGNSEISTNYGQVYRVLRGGSFMTNEFETRCAARHFDVADKARADYGFRCAMDIGGEPTFTGR